MGNQMAEMHRDAKAMLFWALLDGLLWGEFALKPRDPARSLRELMSYVKKRQRDKWTIDDNGRGFRISATLSSRDTRAGRGSS